MFNRTLKMLLIHKQQKHTALIVFNEDLLYHLRTLWQSLNALNLQKNSLSPPLNLMNKCMLMNLINYNLNI